MKKRLLAILLSLTLVLSVAPAFGITAAAELVPAPDDATLSSYAEAGQNLVVACYVDDGVMLEGGSLMLAGTYNSWYTGDISTCAQFVPVEGFDGWYVVAVADSNENIEIKPVYLLSGGNFDWDYQCGSDVELIRGTATIVPGYDNDADIKAISDSAPLLLHIKSLKTPLYALSGVAVDGNGQSFADGGVTFTVGINTVNGASSEQSVTAVAKSVKDYTVSYAGTYGTDGTGNTLTINANTGVFTMPEGKVIVTATYTPILPGAARHYRAGDEVFAGELNIDDILDKGVIIKKDSAYRMRFMYLSNLQECFISNGDAYPDEEEQDVPNFTYTIGEENPTVESWTVGEAQYRLGSDGSETVDRFFRLFPTSTDGDEYSLWVAGTKVTADNCADILGDGTVSFDAETATLTLDGVNLTAQKQTFIISHLRDLTVCLAEGSVNNFTSVSQTMAPLSGDQSSMIYVAMGNLTITGSGKLNLGYDLQGMIDGGENSMEAHGSVFYICGSIENQPVTYTARRVKYGALSIEGGAEVTINNQEPDGGVTGNIYSGGYAIRADHSVRVTDATLTIDSVQSAAHTAYVYLTNSTVKVNCRSSRYFETEYDKRANGLDALVTMDGSTLDMTVTGNGINRLISEGELSTLKIDAGQYAMMDWVSKGMTGISGYESNFVFGNCNAELYAGICVLHGLDFKTDLSVREGGAIYAGATEHDSACSGEVTMKHIPAGDPYHELHAGELTDHYVFSYVGEEFAKSMIVKAVAPTDLSDSTVSVGGTYTYTGSPITPTELTVVCNTKTLVLGTDYTVEYSNNVEVGTATVTVTGIGDYRGTATATFEIVAPAEPGDADGDGEVTMSDVLAIRRYIARLDDTMNESAADVNGDGEVNMKDVLMVRKFIAGLITSLRPIG